jgi:hypothetical protein
MYRSNTLVLTASVASVYIFSVYANTVPATYTITASVSDTIQLQDGLPQDGTVGLGSMLYYRTQLDASATDLTISLTPLSGNVEIFVNYGIDGNVSQPTRQNAMKRSTEWFSGGALVFPDNTNSLCVSPGCVYIVGVFGDTASNFSLVATSSTQSQMLQNGIPVRNWANQGSYQYFSFEVTAVGMDLAVLVTALSGDPDLYLSRSVFRPTDSTRDTDRSASFGGESKHYRPSAVGMYFIGVNAYSSSTFSVMASLTSQLDLRPNTQLLVDGVPQSGSALQGDLIFYHLYMAQSSPSLTVSVSRTLGDPDVFIRNDGAYPNSSFSMWRGIQYGSELVVISPAVASEYLPFSML